jgi:hypothetical protein
VTRLLEQAMAVALKLSEADQDALAAIILDELAVDRRWQQSFAQTQDALARLAQQAREQVRVGEVRGLAEFIEQMSALPMEGQQDPFSGVDHDRVLYRQP